MKDFGVVVGVGHIPTRPFESNVTVVWLIFESLLLHEPIRVNTILQD